MQLDNQRSIPRSLFISGGVFIWVWFSLKIFTPATKPQKSSVGHWWATGPNCFTEHRSNTCSNCTMKMRMQIQCSATYLHILECLCSKLTTVFHAVVKSLKYIITCSLPSKMTCKKKYVIILKRNSRNRLYPSQCRLIHVLIRLDFLEHIWECVVEWTHTDSHLLHL